MTETEAVAMSGGIMSGGITNRSGGEAEEVATAAALKGRASPLSGACEAATCNCS